MLKKGLSYDDLQVNHIKGGFHIYDNSVNNLEWCTAQENINHAFEAGLRHPPKGEGHHYTFLTTEDVVKICECIRDKINTKDTYNKYDFNTRFDYTTKFKPTFYSIKYKKSWRFISQNYF